MADFWPSASPHLQHCMKPKFYLLLNLKFSLIDINNVNSPWVTYAELPDNFKCLMDCEAAVLLQGIQDRMVSLSRDPAIKIPA